jgi:TPP-dependent indolepyruvate ferredoxin oxidoreductase alpha subunit
MSRSIDRLSSLDRLMLEAGKRWPQHIGALAVLDGTILLDPAGELRIDAVRDAIASRRGAQHSEDREEWPVEAQGPRRGTRRQPAVCR